MSAIVFASGDYCTRIDNANDDDDADYDNEEEDETCMESG